MRNTALDIVTRQFVDDYKYDYIDIQIPPPDELSERIVECKEYLKIQNFSILLLVEEEPLDNNDIISAVKHFKELYGPDFALMVTDSQESRVRVHKEIKIEKDDKQYKSYKALIYDPISKNEKLFWDKISNFDASKDSITTIELNARIDDSLKTDKVTKKFFTEFQKEHKAFLNFIEGIDEIVDREWYASLMMNRLMFTYFIQKKYFLDNDKDYLKNRLETVQKKSGKDKFYSFYKNFLLALFHEGFSRKKDERDSETKELLGCIPYLNGGLFDVHEIEKIYTIKIPDKAFEKIFVFFDKYTWYLDDKPVNYENEINPDVLGYIFEKYINQKQMGAYYTKEDITEYISKNSIIPFLFDRVKEKYPAAFAGNGRIWTMLKESGDKYIYSAVKHGLENIEEMMPEDIKQGLDTSEPGLLERRKFWNRKTDKKFALPTEIWRETIDRWNRCKEVKEKISSGSITSINDFITYNLNITAFVKDLLNSTDDEKLIKEFFDAAKEITVLDPTCGSGAFLFAALSILSPVYETCVEKMREFISDKEKKRSYLKEFKAVIAEVNTHPNEKYFIYKAIILNNLYGVDIMHEAVEIAKLRLFLKLASCANYDAEAKNFGLEPLPDIDFNIKTGNTLVGFANFKELEDTIKKGLDFGDNIPKFKEQAEIIGKTSKSFKDSQLVENRNSEEYHSEKGKLQQRLNELNHELNVYLASEYGIDINNIPKKKDFEAAFQAWKESHQPFHWVSEFYEIIEERGGFDVVIGNPPYVEYSKVRKDYQIIGYETESCGNLYAYVFERSYKITNNKLQLGFIVPMSITSIRDYNLLRKFLERNNQYSYYSNHAIRPTSLFIGISQRVTINLNQKKNHRNRDEKPVIYMSKYIRTTGEFKDMLQKIEYLELFNEMKNYNQIYPKYSKVIDRCIWEKLHKNKKTWIQVLSKQTDRKLFFKDYGESYWIFPANFPPYLANENSFSSISFENTNYLSSYFCAYNSTLFYWYYIAISDCWHFGKWHMNNFPLDINDIIITDKLNLLANELKKDYLSNRIKRFDKRINGYLYEYKINCSKNIIDEIDKVLAEHYGFTEEELDYIINYDIKYRMGDELESEE